MKSPEKDAPHPPRWAERLLIWLHPSNTQEEVQGDLEELYTHWYRRSGKTQATIRYVLNVLSALPPFVRRRSEKIDYPKPSLLHPSMLCNYFKTAFRGVEWFDRYAIGDKRRDRQATNIASLCD